jgi:hypothetical protein
MATAGDVFGQTHREFNHSNRAGWRKTADEIKFFVDTGRPSHGRAYQAIASTPMPKLNTARSSEQLNEINGRRSDFEAWR